MLGLKRNGNGITEIEGGIKGALGCAQKGLIVGPEWARGGLKSGRKAAPST